VVIEGATQSPRYDRGPVHELYCEMTPPDFTEDAVDR
jgi:hypothetical protein